MFLIVQTYKKNVIVLPALKNNVIITFSLVISHLIRKAHIQGFCP